MDRPSTHCPSAPRSQFALRRSLAFSAVLTLAVGCRDKAAEQPLLQASASAVAAAAASAPALSTVVVDHGELDTKAPEDSVSIAATQIATIVYARPHKESRRLGYLRLGAVVHRDPEPTKDKVGECKGEWYRVYPMGFVCTEDATTNLEDPLVRATKRRAHLDKPMPYAYGFVRATAPQYLKVPTHKQQADSEFGLDDHMKWFADNAAEVQKVELGSNDVPLDPRGIAVPGLKHPPGFKLSTELSRVELFGGDKSDTGPPWWLEDGRKIPNVSGFEVPDYALFADRVRRKTGLSFVDSFIAKDGEFQRGFAVTVDMRLIPTTKVKPDTGSPFHGVELSEATPVPFAFVVKRDATAYQLVRGKDEVRATGTLPRRGIVPVTGKARIKAGKRFYQTLIDKTKWIRADDVGIVAPPAEWPEAAEKGQKWIDVSLRHQTLVLYEGKRAWYATLVSTGRPRFGDPKTTNATPTGVFHLQSKHIAAAMDSEENSSVAGGKKAGGGGGPAYDDETRATIARLKKAEADGSKLDAEDQRRLTNIHKGRHPEYGVTRRRGAGGFELRDVPWIQYFAAGYALHGAYWHDVFGIPRSHGCINLAPIDARLVFMWTDPPLPDGWHGINIGSDMGEGTIISVRE